MYNTLFIIVLRLASPVARRDLNRRELDRVAVVAAARTLGRAAFESGFLARKYQQQPCAIMRAALDTLHARLTGATYVEANQDRRFHRRRLA
jgi:hypothetical protein